MQLTTSILPYPSFPFHPPHLKLWACPVKPRFLTCVLRVKHRSSCWHSWCSDSMILLFRPQTDVFFKNLFMSTVFTSSKSHPVFLKLLTCPHSAFPLRLVNLSKGLFLEKINFPFLIIHCLLVVLHLGVSFGENFPKHVGMSTFC